MLVACCVLASSIDRIANAQSVKIDVDTWYYHCSNWVPPPWDKKGARRLLFLAPLLAGEYPGAYTQGGKTIPGKFVLRKEALIGLMSEPGGSEPTQQFVTPMEAPLDFYAADSPLPRKVRNGRLAVWPTEVLADYLECSKGDSATAFLENREPKSLADLAKASKPSEPGHKLADVFSTAPATERGDATRTDAPAPKPGDEARTGEGPRDKSKLGSEPPLKPEAPSSLRDVFAPTPTTPSGTATRNPVTPPPTAAARPDTTPAPAESPPRARGDAIALALKNLDTPVPGKATASPSVCETRTLTPLPVANGMVPASLQAVGLRNARAEARSFEYSGTGTDARALEANLDIGDSARKLVRYETVAGGRRNGAEWIWVSLPGTDESRLRRTGDATAKTLTMMVVGGAAEVAVSGLDLVGNELRKPGANPVNLDIEWHAVDETGAIKLAGRYSSFDALVRDAAARGRAAPDLLGESQLLTLFNGFENLLKSRTATVDKVFWIKGAYPIPSSIPGRFERFLSTVSDSTAVPHTPAGKPGKWLLIITARMAGFSIAYLKEPITSQAVGDVLEEAPGAVSGPRRLISAEDANVLASNLRAALILSSMTKPVSDAPPERETLTGRLVLDAKEVFDERGYLLSAEAAEMLRDHLLRVSGLWDGPVLRQDVLAALAEETGKASPTIADVLQVAAHYPQLPKLLPDWFMKPVKYLTPSESNSAKIAVATYAAGASRLAEAVRMSTTARANCALFYVAEAYFGFDRLQKSSPGRQGVPKPGGIR